MLNVNFSPPNYTGITGILRGEDWRYLGGDWYSPRCSKTGANRVPRVATSGATIRYTPGASETPCEAGETLQVPPFPDFQNMHKYASEFTNEIQSTRHLIMSSRDRLLLLQFESGSREQDAVLRRAQTVGPQEYKDYTKLYKFR